MSDQPTSPELESPDTPCRCGGRRPSSCSVSAFAEGVWNAAKKQNLTFDDLITVSAILLRSIEANTGEDGNAMMKLLAKRAVRKQNSELNQPQVGLNQKP